MTFTRVAFIFLLTGQLLSCGVVQHTPGPEARIAAKMLAEQAGSPGSDTGMRFQLFAKVFDQVRTLYVDEIDDVELMTAAADGMRKAFPEPANAAEEKLVVAAINGMLGSLDPYSAYLNNRSYRAMRDQTQGAFGGIGLQVTKEGEFIKVISPIDGTPAAQAGMKSGDVITHADGQPLGAMTLRDSVLLLRGPTGSRVLLTVKRADMKPFDVLIVRALIHIQSVRWSLEKGIGYVRISSFTEKATREFVDAVVTMRSQAGDALQGIVLDLRNNPGG